MVALHAMPDLSVLFVSGTQISDCGLKHLRELIYVDTLGICGTDVTEAGLLRLQMLPALHTLFVSGRLITPAGITALQKLPALKELFVERTDDWATIHAELTQALPGVKVVRYIFP